MSYTIGVVCEIGIGAERGGRSANEDNYLICQGNDIRYLENDREHREQCSGDGLLLAVCDGMGGHEHGQVASTTAARVMAKLHRPGSPKDPPRSLIKYIQESHRQLYWRARDNGPVKMGTTLTVCWILNGNAVWAQVGDSRLYLFRNDNLIRLTPEHTRNEFARRDGREPSPDGDHLCQTFIYGSRGIGDNTSLRLELGFDSGSEPLLRDDMLLLCSDGLSGALDDVDIADVLRRESNPDSAAEALLHTAIAHGSTDNVTALIIRVDEAPEVSLDEWNDDGEETVMF